MFAVPGWNIPTNSLTTQTLSPADLAKKEKIKEKLKTLKEKKKAKKNASEGNTLPLGKKRAIGHGSGDGSGDDIEDWNDGERGRKIGKAAEGKEEKIVKKKGPKVTEKNLQNLYEKVIERKVEKKDGDGSAVEGKKKRKRGKKATPKSEKNEASTTVTNSSNKDTNQSELAKISSAPPSKKQKKNRPSLPQDTAAAPPAPSTTAALSTIPALTPLQQKMRAKLTSARFRHLNETLYTTPSQESFSLFRSQPSMFTDYHAGFRQQVQSWPENPVDVFIIYLLSRAKVRPTPKTNHHQKSTQGNTLKPLPRPPPLYTCTIADLGCGDAKLAATVIPASKKSNLNLKVLSYDLSNASNPDLVTEADIAHLPLPNESVDISIFCLALMGTNYLDFIEEAFRILRFGGELWIAEIKSRFTVPGEDLSSSIRKDIPSNNGKIGVLKKSITLVDPSTLSGDLDDPDLGTGAGFDETSQAHNIDPVYIPFINALTRRGFLLRGGVDDHNKMFVRMEFVKPRPRGGQDKKGEGDGEEGEEYDLSQISRGGKGGRMGKRGIGKGKGAGGKWLGETEEDVRKREEKILKPCVYKLR